MKVDFRLRDYLSPNGKRPYKALAPDLEAEVAKGNTVYLWSVPGFFVLSGTPDTNKLGKKYRPWSDGNAFYKTAKDCLNGKNGQPLLRE